MAFIKLTELNGEPIYVNAVAIEAFFAEAKGSRVVPRSDNDSYTYYSVRETPDEIMKIINDNCVMF